MKIIKHEPEPKYTKQIVCRNCAVTLEYTNADIKSINFPDWTGNDYNPGIVCPNCGHKMMVSYI